MGMTDCHCPPRLERVCDLPDGWTLHADPAGVPWLESPEGLLGVAGRGPHPLAWREPLRRIASPFTRKHQAPTRDPNAREKAALEALGRWSVG